MTSDGITFISWFFQTFWIFFNSWKIPGTGLTPAAFFIGSSVLIMALKFILSVVSQVRIGSSSAVVRSANNLSKRSSKGD